MIFFPRLYDFLCQIEKLMSKSKCFVFFDIIGLELHQIIIRPIKMRNKSDYEVIRDDKFFELTIPKFEKNGDAVFYEVHLKDLVSHRDYVRLFRFN